MRQGNGEGRGRDGEGWDRDSEGRGSALYMAIAVHAQVNLSNEMVSVHHPVSRSSYHTTEAAECAHVVSH